RIGKNGKTIYVYKMRTMHPYSEYLQEYVYAQSQLQEGGKFKNDFRVHTAGKIMRKFWIDELPMLFNLLKGDLKIVGVRPLSQHYFDLYYEELREKRIKIKPGLVPPFYTDMPKTLEEIQESELRYLDAYDKRPFLTDMRYFWKAMYNIVFRKARSK
ncbi:MAG: sugar transferase, partial [Bacteroidales bacterium]|nr:sugar transferase [Bacteroidales bacterium]